MFSKTTNRKEVFAALKMTRDALSLHKGTLNELYVYYFAGKKLKFLHFMIFRKIKFKPGCIWKRNCISSLLILLYIPSNGIKSFRLHPAHFKSKC